MSGFIDPARLEEGSVIGHGAFGVVKKGRLRDRDGVWHEVAIKQLQNASAYDSSRPETPLEQFMEEVVTTIRIAKGAPNVVQCFGWSTMKDGQHCLVMKLYTKSLHALIAEAVNAIPVHTVVVIALDVARGLLQLHNQRIVFQDLKPSNVLLGANWRAFLSDFGLSKPLQDLSHQYTSSCQGTYLYMAPETLRKKEKRMGFSADMWAFAITVIQMLKANNMAPYGFGTDLPDLLAQLLVDKEPPAAPAVPEAPELQALLQSCLDLNYDARPTASYAVQVLESILRKLKGADNGIIDEGHFFSASERASSFFQAKMGSKDVEIQPTDLRFWLEPNKQLLATFSIINPLDTRVAYKIKVTAPKKYVLRPSSGIAEARSQANVQVIMQAQKEYPPDFQNCRDRFMIQVTPLDDGETLDSDTFNKKLRREMQEHRLRVIMESCQRRESGARTPMGPPEGRDLVAASTEGRLEDVRSLLSSGAPVDFADKNGETSLHRASRNGHTAVVKELLAAGADVNKADERGRTPLYEASYNEHSAVVKDLLAAGADVNKAEKNGETPLHLASRNGHTAVVEDLLAAGVDVNKANKDGETPLHLASKKGRSAVVKDLLAAGADVNKADENGRTPLYEASYNERSAVVKILLSAGADVNKANKNGWTPLHTASNGGHSAVVKDLLAAGTDVNKADEDGRTPLHKASWNGHSAVVKELLAAGADVNKADKYGDALLHDSSYKGHLAVVKDLLAAGADVNKANKDGRTPLHKASWNGHSAVVKELLAVGADVNKANKNGWTPLHTASNGGHSAVVKDLLAAGADVNKADEDGCTPLDKAYASTSSSKAVTIKLLRAYGAKTARS